jgi:hypothetical protein
VVGRSLKVFFIIQFISFSDAIQKNIGTFTEETKIINIFRVLLPGVRIVGWIVRSLKVMKM